MMTIRATPAAEPASADGGKRRRLPLARRVPAGAPARRSAA